MAKEVFVSKAFAIGVVTLTASAITGIITMVIVYQLQYADMDPTPRPTIPQPTTLPTGPPPNLRLPGNLVPESYRLYLKPHLYHSLNTSDVNATKQMLVFTGNSTVNFQCVNKTKSIYLHSKNLTILEVIVKDRDTGELLPSHYVEYHDGTDFLEVVLKEDALAERGNYSLSVDFQGEMQDDLSGMYISSYEEDGLTKYVTTTQLEPTDARKVFPCFDEPQLKATFHVTVIHRLDTTALGNWGKDASGTEIFEGWQYTTFTITKPMSTYLLAIAVFTTSEFPSNEITVNNNNVEIKTYTRKAAHDAGQAVYATEVTGKILKFFIDYFGINYSINKLDQFVVPDHHAAAMENWGLIVYEETSLLYQENTSAPLRKEDIVDVVAHELAHQWFGNLVTMKWWNDIWLNEGFATYLATLGVAHAEPGWNIKELTDMENRLSAFQMDALNSSLPLSPSAEDIQTYSQIVQMFNTITYFKGATLLRMLENLMTEPVFHTGVKLYLQEFQFKNADTQDLWKCMQKAHDKHPDIKVDIAEVMNTWTQQNGYPVLTINTTNGEVYQKDFTLKPFPASGHVWSIPIHVLSGETKELKFVLLDTDTPVFKAEFQSTREGWILANINASGYYRVNYNPENWMRLMLVLDTKPTDIPVMSRGQLIDDAFNLARAKLVSVTLALNTTRYLRKETEFIPWQAAIKNLNYIVAMFDRSIVHGPMQIYMQELVRPLYMHFKTDTNNSTLDHSQQRNQVNAIQVACSNALPECVDMAKEEFGNWMNNYTNYRIPPNLEPVILCHGVAAGGYNEWQFVWNIYINTTIKHKREDLFTALCCTSKIWLLNSLLEYTLDPEKNRNLDVVRTIGIIGQNPVGQSLAWNFVRAHWTYLCDLYGEGSVSYLVLGLATRFNTDFELQEVKQLQIAQNATEDILMNQAIDVTQTNIHWVKENKQPIFEWFLEELKVDTNSTQSI